MRERYETLIAKPAAIDEILHEGARKARAIATPKLAALRDAIGLRAGSGPVAATAARPGKAATGKAPRLASFRDAQGFRFRLFSAEGEELLLSIAFDDPKAAGAVQKRLKTLGSAAAVWLAKDDALVLQLDEAAVASSPTYADAVARDAALVRLQQALDQLAVQD